MANAKAWWLLISVSDTGRLLSAPALSVLTCLSMCDPYNSMVHWQTDALLWEPLWEPLRALTQLRELYLYGNSFGDAGAAVLALHIGAYVQLRALDIAQNDITAAGALGREIFRLPHLMQLASEQAADQRNWYGAPRVLVFEVPEAAARRGLEVVTSVNQP